LQREHIKETVGKFRAVAAVQILQTQGGDVARVVGHHPHEQPLLQALDHKNLHRLEGSGHAKANHQHQRDHHHGPDQHTESNRVDQGFHGNRCCQGQDRNRYRENDNYENVTPFGLQDLQHPTERPGLSVPAFSDVFAMTGCKAAHLLPR